MTIQNKRKSPFPLWRKQLWGHFQTMSKQDIRQTITLPKLDCMEKFYEEMQETKIGQRTARDIRKSYCK